MDYGYTTSFGPVTDSYLSNAVSSAIVVSLSVSLTVSLTISVAVVGNGPSDVIGIVTGDVSGSRWKCR